MDILFALAALTIGISAGLRSATPWAILAIASWAGFIRFPDGLFSFLNWTLVTFALVLAALGEYFVDKQPWAPNRTAFPLLIGRIFSGSLAGLAFATATGRSPVVAISLGAVGAVVGAFGGFSIRTKLAADGNKIVVAIVEDIVAILIAVLAVAILVRTITTA